MKFDKDITKIKRVTFFLRHSVVASFVYSRIIFVKQDSSLSADVDKFCFMQIRCNVVTVVGLTNDERCLIHNLRVEKHCRGSESIMKMFPNK